LPAAPVMVVVTVFAAITLAAASVVLPVTATAVMATAPAVCVADPVGTGAAMSGPLGRLLWAYDSPRFERGRSKQLHVAAASAPAVRSGRVPVYSCQ
jgi:hypothetical protein